MLKKYWYIIAGILVYFFITNKAKIAPKFKGKIGAIPKPEKLD